jgi:hypothetical protein
MSIIALLLAALVVIPAVGMVSWVGLAMSKANDDLRTFVGFEGMHFENMPVEA